LDEVQAALRKCHEQDWHCGPRYYFIPPADWQYQAISQVEWRAGHVFRTGELNGHNGPVDRGGRVWAWGGNHWDVQLRDGTHRNINQSGEETH